MTVKITNNGFSTLASGINNSVTTIALASGEGARFPNPSSPDVFYATLIDTSNNLEIVKVTARSTDSLTVVRAQDNTSARAFSTGDRFELRPVAKLFEDIQAEARDLNGAELVLDADGDTSITADTDDQIDFKAGGTDTMHIINGKVGIGTTAPAQSLHVKASDARVRTEESSGSTTFEMTNTSGGHFLDSSGTNDLTINKSGSANLILKTANTERMRIDSSGNLQFNSGYGSVVTAYGVRAWVNFNGTGTVAIRASGGVSSIADRGTGLYTVVLSTAMPDNNFCGVATAIDNNTTDDNRNRIANAYTKDANEVYVNAFTTSGGVDDVNQINVVIVR